ncbi:helix-turn-helix transcriptional regulator [Glycomyces sp. TRM65418]|uniref:helix-turn-helix transcriptional regulator n=1 Tax=Glycomyces sp. TRM65418 TaxID=2867006 RepID=UPI001CE5AB5A|nr:helix-turn-helix transcriptional regulator [Glycomyces sp. TRM65418]MCC3761929.1 helix-turn-helix transcriptional regulator [Glycomyces sp. TRM65418]QZD56009.1 helix-turn-helix transcriptional regulator [Glycomyces sp. TRM65418]
MPSAATYARARDDLVRLVHRGLDVPAFAREVNKVLGRIVPGEGSCLQTVDPATMLPTGDYVEDGLPSDDILRLIEIELAEPDVNKWIALRNAGTAAAGLAEATRGELDRSARQREVRRPGGFEDEIRIVLASGAGAWGGLTLFRESNRPHYTPTEIRRLASLAPVITDGLRRAALLSGAAEQDDHGVLVLNPDDSVAMSDHGADRWLDRLSAGARVGARLPLAISAVARHARLLLAGGPLAVGGAQLARATVHTTGGWLVVRGSVLGDGPEAPVAVTLEGARAPEMAGLIAAAYGLTEREREVTALVARGNSTAQIARDLHLSAYTVQDYLKSVFDKTGTSSRGGLVSRLYFDFYAEGLSDQGGAVPTDLPDHGP